MMNKKTWFSPIARFLSAQTISLFGSSIVQYAIIWHITLSTSSGKMLTLSTLCGFLPQVIISLFAGVCLDRYSRKTLVMLSDTLIACATALLAFSLFQGQYSTPLLFIVLMIRSMGSGIQNPAVNSIIPQLVSKDELMKINGIYSTLSSMILFISPIIAGMILSFYTIEYTLLLDIITALIGVGITFFIPIPYKKQTVVENTYYNELKGGFQYVKEHITIRSILLYQVAILFLISPSAFLTPLLVSQHFGNEVFRLSMSEMSYSLGMILGGFFISIWKGFSNKLHTVLVAGGLYGCFMIGIGCSPSFLLYILCNACIGITSPCYNTPLTVTIQERIPSNMHGRIFSLMQIASSCALPLGMAFFGPFADIVDTRYILICCGVLVLLITLFVHMRKSFSIKTPINREF